MPVLPPRARIAVLGCGAVGSAFAATLAEARPRASLVLWSRSEASVARCLAAVAAAGRPAHRVDLVASAGAALAAADVALLCVADAALPALARELAAAPGARRRVVLAASGSVPLARLARLERAGAAVGRLHPLLPLLPVSGAALWHAPFGIEGRGRALAAARSLVGLFEGVPLELASYGTAAAGYHAGAALLGGGLVALLELAERALAPRLAPRVRRDALREALLVFCEEVCANVRLEGPARALTGPVARGDAETVRAHLDALRAVPDAEDAYRVLGRAMIRLARASARAERRLDPRSARALALLLARRRPARKA